MPRRPSEIAAVMSRSDSSMRRSVGTSPQPVGRRRSPGTRPLTTPGESAPRALNRAHRDADPLAPAPPGPAGARGCLPRWSGGSVSQSRGAPLRRGALAVVLVTASVAGYAGAAAYSALASPVVPVASDFGPGDGLTRSVPPAGAGVSPADLVRAITPADGVVNAQPVGADRALVATEGLAPHDLEALPGVADAESSPAVPVAAGTVADPYWPQYGWNLENTGTNAYGQSAVADADDDVTTGWQAGTGEDVVVAVVDTGYDSDHPDLAGALWTNPAESCGPVDRDGNGKAGDCHGWNFTTGSADVDNGAGGTHGASVAGAVGARAGNGLGTAGVAPGVTIMPLVIGTGGGGAPSPGAPAGPV